VDASTAEMQMTGASCGPNTTNFWAGFYSRRLLLAFGIGLRILTFAFLAPENVDGHGLVVSYIAQHGAIPHSGELGQAYHPPLYYCLVSPIYRLTQSFKAVQLFSLLLSVLTLLVLYALIYHSKLIRSEAAERYSFLLACFLPQFILYGLFVSNDTLTIFLGCALAWAVVDFSRHPSVASNVALGSVAALGLLTKATFLAYIPALFCLLYFSWLWSGRSRSASISIACATVLLLLAVSSYKEIDNYRQYRHAFVSNIDFWPDWAIRQKATYRGLSSFFDFNFLHLLRSPSYSSATETAYPLMLYGTFWYQHVPECNFIGSVHWPFTWIGAVTYLIAAVPSIVFAIGIWTLMKQAPGHFFHRYQSCGSERHALAIYALAGLLVGNLAIMLMALAKYHVWSIMQGRLLFPSFFALLAIFSIGLQQAETNRAGASIMRICMSSLSTLFLIYLFGEIGFQVISHRLPGLKEHLKLIVT
jgi:4-amino-4-deoxy-L-arabinose transferase-like glycosyltransferase